MTYNKSKPIFKKSTDMHSEDSQLFVNSHDLSKINGLNKNNSNKLSGSQLNTFSYQNLNII